MTVATRASVQRWSSTQPCAAGPCSSSATSSGRHSGLNRLGRPLGPVERSASTPPARQRAYQARADFARLLDATHQQPACRPIVLVWDNSPQHTDRAMRALLAERSWLTVFQLPAYAPDLNPDEGVWAHLKKTLANLAPCTIDQLATLIRARLKRMQYRPALLDGFIAETGLVLTP